MATRPTEPRLFRYNATRRRWQSTWYDDQGHRRSKAFGFDTDTSAKQAKARFDFWMLTWRSRADIRNPAGRDAEYTITRMAAGYLRHASRTYRKDGKRTSHVWNVKYAMRSLRDSTIGRQAAVATELKDIIAIRDGMIHGTDQRGNAKARSLKTVNTRLKIIQQAFVWAAQQGHIPSAIATAVGTAERLKRDRSEAVNPKKVKPIHQSIVEQTLPYLAPVLADLVKFLSIQGCRPEEACSMRVCELETSGEIWLYRPRHKLEHMEGQDEVIRFLGPRAQAIIRPYLNRDLSAYIFSPLEAHRQRMDAKRKARKTKRWPSHAKQYTGTSGRIGDHYTTETLRRAIHYACKMAGIGKWNPNQLRHDVATRMRQQYGSELGMAFIGHKHLSTFEIYAEKNAQAAMRIAREVG